MVEEPARLLARHDWCLETYAIFADGDGLGHGPPGWAHETLEALVAPCRRIGANQDPGSPCQCDQHLHYLIE
jgi:hypothetical protein